ncbi:MAG: Gfo/Idh/MocA family oxidoreductase, partial [Vicingaceae bacterium]
MLKIGVLGAGHLGKIHIRILLEHEDFALVGFYDPNKVNAAAISAEFNLKAFDTIDELLSNVDAIDIVTPTLSHYDCADKAIRQRKHVFIEKPITNTVEEAKKLINLSEEAQI